MKAEVQSPNFMVATSLPNNAVRSLESSHMQRSLQRLNLMLNHQQYIVVFSRRGLLSKTQNRGGVSPQTLEHEYVARV